MSRLMTLALVAVVGSLGNVNAEELAAPPKTVEVKIDGSGYTVKATYETAPTKAEEKSFERLTDLVSYTAESGLGTTFSGVKVEKKTLTRQISPLLLGTETKPGTVKVTEAPLGKPKLRKIELNSTDPKEAEVTYSITMAEKYSDKELEKIENLVKELTLATRNWKEVEIKSERIAKEENKFTIKAKAMVK